MAIKTLEKAAPKSVWERTTFSNLGFRPGDNQRVLVVPDNLQKKDMDDQYMQIIVHLDDDDNVKCDVCDADGVPITSALVTFNRPLPFVNMVLKNSKCRSMPTMLDLAWLVKG